VKEDALEPVFSSGEIDRAYLDCRRRKRGTKNALRFEMNLVENLDRLETELNSGAYKPSRSVCFVNLRPKPREIFAADFRDRIVHHLFVREVEKYWERVFIPDSFACRQGKGTHAAVDRLESLVRSVTRGGRRRAWFLQVDIANFFMSIDRRVLLAMIEKGLRKQYGIPEHKLHLFCANWFRFQAMSELARTLILHDCTEDFSRKSPASEWRHVENRKSLFHCEPEKGLPIGNLTSQFFGNVYLNALDQFVKHELKTKRYIRYVDDFLLLHEDKEVLRDRLSRIEAFAFARLGLRLNQAAVKIRPVSCGINFLGYIVHPDHRLARRRVAGNFGRRLEDFRKRLVVNSGGCTLYLFDLAHLEKLLAALNSYLAHFEKAASARLLKSILQEHAWIKAFFLFKVGKAERRWKPPREFPNLGAQYGWHRWRYPKTTVLIQVGRFFELYDDQALAIAEQFGLAPSKPRIGARQCVGVPGFMAKPLARKIACAGKPTLVVNETGYPLSRIKERFPAVIFA
jgi:retron-type reverse transcriptase